jgi:hypothetical protein
VWAERQDTAQSQAHERNRLGRGSTCGRRLMVRSRARGGEPRERGAWARATWAGLGGGRVWLVVEPVGLDDGPLLHHPM